MDLGSLIDDADCLAERVVVDLDSVTQLKIRGVLVLLNLSTIATPFEC